MEQKSGKKSCSKLKRTIVEISKILGHSQVETTMQYITVDQDSIKLLVKIRSTVGQMPAVFL